MKNIIVGQSGGPTSAINASLAGVYAEAKKYDNVKVYGMITGIQGLIEGKYVDLDDYIKSEDDIRILKQTPSSALGSCRYKLPKQEDDINVYEKIFDELKKLDVECFVYIGGNDSMDTVKKLSKYARDINSDIRFVGVPKTIDNDLPVTDYTPGFGSAAKYISTLTKEIICDSYVYDLKSVTVIEIMGRNAGWLTASAALAKDDDCVGVDMIYLPEMSFDIEACKEKTKELLKEKNTVVIAVSEALRNAEGNYITEDGSVHAGLDAFGHKIMSGTGQFLAQYLGKSLNVKSRGIELNTPQRCAAHIASRQDLEESFDCGSKAVEAAKSGESGKMMVIVRDETQEYSYHIEAASIEGIANFEKKVPLDWIINDGSYVSDEFIKYCRPLICGDVHIVKKNGLPVHFRIDK